MTGDTTALRYPRGSQIADYVRAGLGLGFSLPVLLLIDPATFVLWVFGLFAGVSALFLARTVLRSLTVTGFDQTAVWQAGPRPRRIAWEALTDLSLKFFSTRRDRSVGWMQLTLAGGGTRIRLESTLDGFDALTERAFLAARDCDLPLTDATLANLMALGLDPKPPGETLAERWGVTGGALHDPHAGSGG